MTCPSFASVDSPAIATALRAVDCFAAETTQTAFSRMFGSEGGMTTTLTIGLTLYVALFAIGLLTGRATLSLSALTPRMMSIGLVLTFATSWVAYSSVIWALLSAGPDWIAGLLLGVKGSASQAFAGRLDMLFAAVADAATQAQAGTGGNNVSKPADLLSYAALLLLLGTVGVLVTSKIALAALLAVGPAFFVLALFAGTRGLFEGWVKAAVMFALVPLFTVLIGVASVSLLNPVVAQLSGGEVDLTQAATVFVAAAVHCALMIMALKLVTTLVSGWTIPFLGKVDNSAKYNGFGGQMPLSTGHRFPVPATSQTSGPEPRGHEHDDRVRAIVSAANRPHSHPHSQGADGHDDRTRIVTLPGARIIGPATTPLHALNTPNETSRADKVGRNLRLVHPASSVKETLS